MLHIGPALALVLAAGPRVAVMPIAAGDAISDKSASFLTETLAAEIRQQSGAEVVTARDLTSLLSLEKQKQALGCSTDRCMVEIAGAVGAERLVTGDVAKLGESLLLQLRLLDASKGRVIAQSRRRYKNGTFDDVLDALPAMAAELLRGPAAEATAAQAPPPAQTPRPAARAASDSVVLHYHRADGRYGAIRLVTWESYERGSELRQHQRARVPGDNGGVLPPSGHRVELLEPSGTDASGVFWRLPASRYRNGRVNFVVANGGAWDECGGETARFWLLQDGAEAWASAPECEVLGAPPRALDPPAPKAKPTVEAPRLAAAPGTLALHYHRADGHYDSARLVTWESFETSRELRQPQHSIVPRNNGSINAPRTMHLPLVSPAGRDAFGAYWTIPAERYRNGRVNFVVAVGGDWEECGVDVGRFWLAQDGREAWYVECEVYTDPERAARAATPR